MYFLFGSLDIPSSGGMDDYIGGFDEIADAKAKIEGKPYEWAQIAALIDSTMIDPYGLRVVWRYDRRAGWKEEAE